MLSKRYMIVHSNTVSRRQNLQAAQPSASKERADPGCWYQMKSHGREWIHTAAAAMRQLTPSSPFRMKDVSLK